VLLVIHKRDASNSVQCQKDFKSACVLSYPAVPGAVSHKGLLRLLRLQEQPIRPLDESLRYEQGWTIFILIYVLEYLESAMEWHIDVILLPPKKVDIFGAGSHPNLWRGARRLLAQSSSKLSHIHVLVQYYYVVIRMTYHVQYKAEG
jgi:hypothetical protein